MISRAALGIVVAASFLVPASAEDEQESRSIAPLPERIQFNRDIRPILSENCVECPGPSAQARKGNLRLDVRESAFAPAESGKIALVPGDLKKSELWARAATADAAEE